jgi:hypothetical protein
MNIDLSPLFTLLIIGLIAIGILLVIGGYNIFDFFFIEEAIESRELIVPEIKLTTDGATIDTLYIYKFK